MSLNTCKHGNMVGMVGSSLHICPACNTEAAAKIPGPMAPFTPVVSEVMASRASVDDMAAEIFTRMCGESGSQNSVVLASLARCAYLWSEEFHKFKESYWSEKGQPAKRVVQK